MKWRPKVMAIEESKDLSTLHLDELIGTLKVFKVVLEKDSKASKNKLSKTKNKLLDNEVFKLKERLKKLEKNKALDEVCIGFTYCKALTSEVKSTKTIEKADKKASDVPDLADPFERDLASIVEGIRATDAAVIKLKSLKHLKPILFK
ncbi:hypothetical protein Tco_0140106 [Tanacetum coccineum]